MDPYIGELRLFGFPFAPQGWAQCQGQLLPISQYSALFSLLGVFYGGDGHSTFGLPDLRGRVPLGVGQGPNLSPRDQGEVGGEEQVTLTAAQGPPHTHPVAASADASAKSPGAALPAYTAGGASYGVSSDLQMSATMIGPNTGGQPHDNLPPYVVLNWCIALVGVFPSRP